MERAKMEPVIIEDLVDYGYDLGLAAAYAESLQSSRIDNVLVVLSARGLALTPTYEQRLRSCTARSLLMIWLRRAATVASIDEVFAEVEPAQLAAVISEDLLEYDRLLAKDNAMEAAAVLVTVLSARGIALTRRDERNVRTCGDRALLATWYRRAATASSIEEVFSAE